MSITNIQELYINTKRLKIFCLMAGDENKQPVILVHGNVSSNLFWNDTIKFLADKYRVIAPDLRGYGKTESLPIDATRGLRDWSDDLDALMDAMGLYNGINMIGWSMGGGVIMQYAIDHSDKLASLILESPVSPFGFGGTKDINGTPCYENFAGSGGGTANPDYVDRLSNGDRSEESPNSPRNVMNNFYFKPPFRVEKDKEETYVTSMLMTRIGDKFYPGDYESCTEWPGVKPGIYGINNAMSPKYQNLREFIDIPNKIPVLWIRGANDLIVSDNSFLDFGYLGQQGFVPGWPGNEIYPPQPMVSQMRDVLEKYRSQGGRYVEEVFKDCGHSPHIEKADRFNELVTNFIDSL